MFNLHHKSDLLEIQRFSCALSEANAKLAAVSRSMAMIEFDPAGVILDANENFCKAVGYSLKKYAASTIGSFAKAITPRARSTNASGVSWSAANPAVGPSSA